MHERVDGPCGPKVLKVLKLDSGLWPLRVVVAAGVWQSGRRRAIPTCSVVHPRATSWPSPPKRGRKNVTCFPSRPIVILSHRHRQESHYGDLRCTVSRLKGRPFYGQSKSQLRLTRRPYAGPSQPLPLIRLRRTFSTGKRVTRFSGRLAPLRIVFPCHPIRGTE